MCQILMSEPEVPFGAVTLKTLPDVLSMFIVHSFVGLLFSDATATEIFVAWVF